MAYNRGSTFTETVETLHPGSKSNIPGDEIFTWLQYPLLDCTFERGYCLELFGSLSSSLGNAKPDSDQGVPISMENAGRRGASADSENAKDALALGAGRASGFVLPEGAETFNKVKTLLQQAPCLQSNTFPQKGSSHLASPSPLEIHHESCEPFHASVQSQGHTSKPLLADKYPACGASDTVPTNYLWSSVCPISPNRAMETLQHHEEAAACSTLCEASHLINSNGVRAGSAQITRTQGSSYSLITEDHMRDDSLHAASAGHWGSLRTTPYDAGTSVRLAPLCKERQWQETSGNMHAEVPDVAGPSCSGGSQTSAEMSAKETYSMGKQKLEDYDCQSKNAEVDSAEISQPHRRPSKRSRVAESHNLSEKRRRNRINEKLKTLQELIPNSSKTDKASILDEAIEYLKALQSQLQMMSSRSGMKLSPMGFPPVMQHIHMGHPMGLGFPLVHAGMGMGMGMGMMDLPHGMDGRPFQALSATSPHFNLAYPVTAPLPSQTCSQPLPSMEVPSSEFWPMQQPPAHAYQQVYIEEPQTVSNIEMHQQGEQLSTPKDG